MTSSSRNSTTSPRAASTPAFLAAARPPLSWRTTRIDSPRSARIAGVSSVDPSSTTTTSPGGGSCAARASRQRARTGARLYVGTTTLSTPRTVRGAALRAGGLGADRILRPRRRDVRRDAGAHQRVQLLAVERRRLDVARRELVHGIGLALLPAAGLAVERLADAQADGARQLVRLGVGVADVVGRPRAVERQRRVVDHAELLEHVVEDAVLGLARLVQVDVERQRRVRDEAGQDGLVEVRVGEDRVDLLRNGW